MEPSTMTENVEENQIIELEENLPKTPLMGSRVHMVKYEEFWYIGGEHLKFLLTFQKQFQAQDTDFIIASLPKAGTTWLKTLLFAVVNRFCNSISQSPILTHHPHNLVYSLENGIYNELSVNYPRPSFLNDLPSPRLLSTHVPYTSLPQSIKTCKCRILFISRNPLDSVVSQWYFYTKIVKSILGDDEDHEFAPYSVEEYFEDFIQGRIMNGPFFEHIVEYWKQSLEQPEKVLFLKYEDLKDDPVCHLKRIAEFVGMPFSHEEEKNGVITNIIQLCSINSLKELDINKNGTNFFGLSTNNFFRKGEVGDWTNYFTPPMVERMNKLMQQKLEATDLTFKLLPHDD